MRLRAFKYRIYPSKEQEIMLRKTFGCVRFVYNWALDTKIRSMESDNELGFQGISKMLTQLRADTPFLQEVSSQSLQQAIRNLDGAFVRYFRGGKRGGFPRFKKKGKVKDSFRAPQHCRMDFKRRTISAPKLKDVPAVLHRSFEGVVKSVTFSMSRTGKFYASVLVEEPFDVPSPTLVDEKTAIGMDLGIKSFAVISDGRNVENKKFLSEKEKRIRFWSRKLFKRMIGGKNWEKARKRLARTHERVVLARKDYLHKVSNEIADKNHVGTIFVENLNASGMMKNHSLAKSIQDCSWSTFVRFLEYKCKWRGINLIKIDRFSPSSRLCPCGFKHDGLTLKDRTWACPRCGSVNDRDLLAARNIKEMGLEQWRRGRPPKACGASGS